MARKVFISFLGTNNYIECNYTTTDGRVVENIKYVQEATISLFCNDYDLFLFFLTDEAKEKNWIGEDGLENRLKAFKERVTVKTIPNGFELKEIWKIFDIIYQEIKENDMLVFDITHAFRSLPMLGMVLMNYLKSVQKVEIQGIYYGAFEALGPQFKVKEIPIEKRNVEIIDLIGFSLLQDWTVAANNFYEFGNVDKLSQIISKEITPILVQTKGKDNNANMLRKLIKPLPLIFENITAVRLKEVYKAKQYNDVKEAMQHICFDNIPQLAPLIEKIEQKLAPFKSEDSILNGFNVVRLCIDYGWIQQAYTILSETTVSYILDKENLDWQKETNRNILNSCFSFLQYDISEEYWEGDAKKNSELTHTLLKSHFLNLLKDDFNELINCRNDINHAGIRANPMPSKKLIERIEKIYLNIVKKIL